MVESRVSEGVICRMSKRSEGEGGVEDIFQRLETPEA